MKPLHALILLLLHFTSHGQFFDYYGPEPFDQILSNTFEKDWTPSALSEISNGSYVVIIESSSQQLLQLDETDKTTVNFQTADFSNSTYGEVLRSIFQLVDSNTHLDNNETPLSGQYQVTPFLHSYFALNQNSSQQLIVSDAGTLQIDEADEKGYLLLEFDGSMENLLIKASAQWTYEDGVLTENTSWTDQWLQVSDGQIQWTSTENEGSSFFLTDATSLIDLTIADGSDFNPNTITYQPNATAELPDDATDITESRLFTDLSNRLDEQYQTQLSTSAETAASEALDQIETTLENAGLNMRYPKEFYLAVRSSMLSQIIVSTDIYGARIDYNTIPYVYFTNATTDDGEPHPFMVVTSHAVSTRPNQLLDVKRPPGAEQGVGYGQTTVTRHGKLGEFLIKIPIRDYGLIDNLEDNDLTTYSDLASDYDEKEGTTTELTEYNYTSLVSNGVAIDGVTIYPAQNNNLRFAVEDAEVTHSGIHVGGGLELHYHADGHAYNGNGINLYNLADYAGKDHPPVIGIAYDGIALFGRYEESYSEMTGYSIELDEYGGHDHEDGFGYHCHAHDQQHTTTLTAEEFTEHFLLVGAWKGNINDIPGFLELKTDQFEDESIARYAGASYSSGSSDVLGLQDQSKPFYPNPATDQLHINLEQPSLITIFGSRGQVVFREHLNMSQVISLKELDKGVYIIESRNNKEMIREKLIVK